MSPVIRRIESSALLGSKRAETLRAMSWQVQLRSTVWSPPTDFYETDDAYVVRVEVAGMREQDFEVNLENNFLVISGVRPDLPERRAYHQMEIRFGRFSTVVGMPGPVNVESAQAVYEDGFLVVTLPKLRQAHF
jgi:HSP20 family protein